jgi:hypothetical protein
MTIKRLTDELIESEAAHKKEVERLEMLLRETFRWWTLKDDDMNLAEIEEMKATHAAEMKKVKATHAAEMEEVKAFELLAIKDMERMRVAHHKEIEEMKATHKREMRKSQ